MPRGGHRVGAGTKKRFPGLTGISITLDPATLELIRRWQRLTGTNRSEAIRDLVRMGAAHALGEKGKK